MYEAMFNRRAPDCLDEVFGNASGIRHGGSSRRVEDQGCGSFDYIKRMRDDRFAQAGWAIVNNTYPCPFALWAYHGPVSTDEEQSRRLTTVSFAPRRLATTIASNCKNLYDSRVDGIGFKGYTSARSDVQNEMRVRLYDPVRRMVASGLAAFRWAQGNGSHHVNLYRLFLWAWGGHIDERLTLTMGRTPTGSVKRLSLRHSKASHLIMAYPNVQSSVVVDAKAITAAQANTSSMYDMMTAITLLRTSGLLEAALYTRLDEGGFAYGFGYLDNANAALVVPGEEESLIGLHRFRAVVPFTEIDTQLSKTAKAVCDYNGMSEVYAVYMTVSTAAAERAFKTLIEEGTLDPVAVQGHQQDILVAKEIRPIPEVDRGAWITRTSRKVGGNDPVVAEIGGSSYGLAPLEMPLGNKEDKLSRIARAWDDTLLLELVVKASMFVEELRLLEARHSAVGCLDLEDWEDNHRMLMPTDRQLRAIINEVASTVIDSELHSSLATVLLKMGAPGLRVYSEVSDSDTLHWVKSFLGTTAAYIARARHVGSLSNRLRRGSAERYSQIVVAEAKNKERTRARVVKAQWLAAAARRMHRAKAAMEGRGDRDAVARENYEAIYLRAAASMLTTRAEINLQAFYGLCITRTITSITRHISGEDESEEYEAALDELPYNLEAMCANVEDTEMAITLAGRVGAALKPSVDVNAMVDAFRLMCDWMERDLSGDHVSTPAIERKLQVAVGKQGARAFALTPMGMVGQGESAKGKEVIRGDVVDKPITLRVDRATVGQDVEEITDLREASADLVGQWAWDIEKYRRWLTRKARAQQPFAVWDAWASSRGQFYAWIEEMQAAEGIEVYEEPEYSMFPYTTWDDDYEGVVEA
jgi:hypothetical protein